MTAVAGLDMIIFRELPGLDSSTALHMPLLHELDRGNSTFVLAYPEFGGPFKDTQKTKKMH